MIAAIIIIPTSIILWAIGLLAVVSLVVWRLRTKHFKYSMRTIFCLAMTAGSGLGLWYQGAAWQQQSLGKNVPQHFHAASFSKQNIVVAGRDGKALVIDLASGQQRVFVHREPVTSASLSVDGKFLVTGTGGQEAQERLWDVETGGQLARTPKALFDEEVFSARFSRDGQRVFCTHHYGIARIWDIRKKRYQSVFPNAPGRDNDGYAAPGLPLCFSPDGRMLVVAGKRAGNQIYDENLLRLYEVDELKLQHAFSFRGHGKLQRARFNPDGNKLFIFTDRSIRILDRTQGKVVQKRTFPKDRKPIAISDDGLRMLTATVLGPHTVEVWGQTGDALATLAHTNADLRSRNWVGQSSVASFSESGKKILVVHTNGKWSLWNRVRMEGFQGWIRMPLWWITGIFLVLTLIFSFQDWYMFKRVQ